MESENASQEEGEFTNVANTRATNAAYNKTPGGNEAARLNAAQGRIIGPGISLKVAAGDTIKMEVFAKYLHNSQNYAPLVTSVASAVAAAYTGGLSEVQSQTVTNAFAGVPRVALNSSTAPRAYLNYIFFDKTYKYQASLSGFKQITSAAATAFEQLLLQTVVQKEGYLYIYVANETAASVDVFFDDLKVTQIETPVRSHTDYYPFGHTIAGLSGESAGTNPNKYLYNGIELQDEFGMNYYHAKYRTLDPVLGRWLQVDPEVESFENLTPYNSNENNPIINADPEGNCPWCIGAIIGGGTEYAAQVISNLADGQDLGDALTDVDVKQIAISTVMGAATGGLSAATKTIGVAAGHQVAKTVTQKVVQQTAKVAATTAAKTTNKVHGNLKESSKIQHGYVIKDSKGKIQEYGISGQKLKADGSSPRAQQKINTKYKGQNVTAEVVKTNMTGRQKGLNWEKGKVEAYKKANDENLKPPRQVRP